MMFFYGFLSLVTLQRLVELTIAKRNEKWLKEQGGVEFGQTHYYFIVLMHMMFFVFLIYEVIYFNRGISQIWPILLTFFLITQAGRIWAMTSLGRHWNTKIIVLPKASPIKKGPYRYLKHPNYVVVSLELLVIPLLFNAYFTALLFALLNIGILSKRIPAEERALARLTEYDSVFVQKAPKNVK
nr:isoprenylcysteine carboxylmethyltransferase family protein [Bacillus sp. T3]